MQFSKYKHGGDEEDRTPDPLRARQVLSQLSYTPMVLFFKAFSIVFSFSFAWKNVVGLTRLELVTSRLSGVRSNQLSYRPIYGGDEEIRTPDPLLARQVLSQLSYTPIYREIFSQNQTMLECARHMPLPR